MTGHRRDRFLMQTFGQYVHYVPVCPEVECGLGVPRETLRLEGDSGAPRLMTRNSRRDITHKMQQWAQKRVKQLERENLCGFIFKSKSPSSGMARIKVYTAQGMPVQKGIGIFARAFMAHFPLIPNEDEGRLHDPKLRETFIEQIFTLKRWREVRQNDPGLDAVVQFHTATKLLLMSHSVTHYRQMGKLVAAGKSIPFEVLLDQYEELLMAALRRKTTVKKHTNVLQHMMGYFKKQLSGDEKQELLEILDQYRSGLIPLIVPVTLINHYVRKYRQSYLEKQIYLHPHPVHLKLRNHA